MPAPTSFSSWSPPEKAGYTALSPFVSNAAHKYSTGYTSTSSYRPSSYWLDQFDDIVGSGKPAYTMGGGSNRDIVFFYLRCFLKQSLLGEQAARAIAQPHARSPNRAAHAEVGEQLLQVFVMIFTTELLALAVQLCLGSSSSDSNS